MASQNNTPPPAGSGPRGSTVAQLKADIDSGRTGDKVELPDPALSPLGTDDEAGGHPPSPEQVAMARAYETRDKSVAGEDATNPALSPRYGWAAPAFIGLIVVLAVIFASMLWLR